MKKIVLMLVICIMAFTGCGDKENIDISDNILVDDSVSNFNSEYQKVEENSDVFLYNGLEIKPKVGDTDSIEADWYMSEQNPARYNISYYNYEKGKFVGVTTGGYTGNTGGYESVENVKTFAFSKKYNVFPRTYTMIEELPSQLIDMADCSNVDIMQIDLDGDSENEYIVCSQIDYSEYDTDTEEASSNVVLLNNKFEKIANIVTLADDFIDGYKVYLSIEDITCIDIDADGIMEILVDIPGWEWRTYKIVKYHNGKFYEGSNIKEFSIAP